MPSRTISRHHCCIVRSIIIKPRYIRFVLLKWNHAARPDVSKRAAIAPVKGHGLGSTM